MDRFKEREKKEQILQNAKGISIKQFKDRD